MISVCVCTYNGARFVREQLASILAELGDKDEVIVCDDASTDATIAVISALNDPRIRIHKNHVNRGHVQNFALAISLASGNFIALSDQDDIWLPGRLGHMLSELRRDERCLLVASNFGLVNDCGVRIGEFRDLRDEPTSSVARMACILLGKMPYFGCTFVFKKELVRHILPIPPYVEAHDIWIALVANMVGRVVNLEQETLLRRLHGANLTGRRRSIKFIARSRIGYFRALFNLLWARSASKIW